MYFHFLMIMSKCQWILTKLGMLIDIIEVWFGIDNGQMLSNISLWRGNIISCFHLNHNLTNRWCVFRSSLIWMYIVYTDLSISLPKIVYSNILKILPPKHENFQIKNSDIFSYFCSKHSITKTRLYNSDPLKPQFYIVKLEFTGVYIIYLISAQNHRLWVLVRTSPRRF